MEIKPCPFCGGKPTVTGRASTNKEDWFVAFVACFCGGFHACAHKAGEGESRDDATEQAIQRWNTRFTPDLPSNPQKPNSGEGEQCT